MKPRRTTALQQILATTALAALALTGCHRWEMPPDVSQIIQATVAAEVLAVTSDTTLPSRRSALSD